MSFRNYLAATRPELPRPGPREPWELQSGPTADAAALAELNADAYDLAWQAYLTSGGYPRAVGEHHRIGRVSESFLTDVEQWLYRDVDRNAPEESIPRLLSELHARTGSPLNRSKTANELGYGSRQSFDTRLVKLVRTFGAIWCRQVRDDGRSVAGAMAKLYLTDPIMAWIGPRLRAGLLAPDMTRLTESALAVALATAVEAHQPGRWATDEAIGFHRSRAGAEVDLAPVPLPTPAGDRLTTPVEVKWVSHGWRSEARAIEARYSAGIVATKNITDTGHPSWALPAPLVALLLH
jgi:predicted AAA+ superfamily ATPase